MFDFHPVEIKEKEKLQKLLMNSGRPGCEYSFGDIYMWSPVYGTKISYYKDWFVSFSKAEDRLTFYSYPAGNGNLKEVIDEIILDSKQRGIKLFIYGLNPQDVAEIKEIYNEDFYFHDARDSYDYVYLTDDLIWLQGRKYHSKRNHIAAFKKENQWQYETINENNIEECYAMNNCWEALNREKSPEKIDSELLAIERGFDKYFELDFTGGLLRANGKIAAFTFGEKMNDECFCTHVEKAYAEIRGAYPMINREFAFNELSGYKYINREDDTGAEGLRKAKLSYYPVNLVEKYVAEYVRD